VADRRVSPEELYARCATPTRRFAYLMTGDHALAEDVVNDCFVKLCARPGYLTGVEDPEAYLRRMVVNAVRSDIRRKMLGRRHADHPPEASVDPIGVVDDRDALRVLLASLTKRQRAAVILRYYVGLTEQETAAEMGCSVGTVKALASRGRAALLAVIADEGAIR
jgi:RNA polymerase sigma-70 factor (sigma-E family)